MTVRFVTLDEPRAARPQRANWGHDAHELVVVPHERLPAGRNAT